MPNPSTATAKGDEPGPRRTYGRAAVRGAAWFLLASTAAQSLSLLTQLALGYLLAEEEFGVYALALSFSSLIVILRNGGMHRILV